MRAQGTASATRRLRAVTVVTITIGAIAGAVVASPALAGSAPDRAAAAARLATGKVHIRSADDTPGLATSYAGRLVSPESARPLPASRPRPAAMVRAQGRLPSGVAASIASANWAGYEDSGTGAQFTYVTGSWTVPAVQTGTTGDSSSWVGIDGIGRSDLIQAGTDQSWGLAGSVYYAWYELLPQDSVELGIVYPGDHITASIKEIPDGSWAISIDDVTQHKLWSQSLPYSAAGHSAEWIVEAPTLSSDNSIEALADFGTVQFSNLAVAGPGTASATGSPVYMENNSKRIIAYPTQYVPSTDTFGVVYGTIGSPPTATPVPIGPTTTTASTGSTTSTTSTTAATHGYWLVGRDGGIFAFGGAGFHGSTGSIRLQRQIAGIAPTADHGGYWLVATDGGVFAFGDAHYAGSVPASGIGPAGSRSLRHLVAPIVGIVPTANGQGYLMVAGDGGVFAFGDARFVGSCASIGGCPAPVAAVVPDATGRGYWLLLSNCDMVAFGDAPKVTDADCESFAHANKLAATAAARTPDGKGYWALLDNGTVYPEGDAKAFGSWHADNVAPAGAPAVAITPTSDGGGAWVVLSNGSVDAFGDAPKLGGAGGKALSAPVVAAAGW